MRKPRPYKIPDPPCVRYAVPWHGLGSLALGGFLLLPGVVCLGGALLAPGDAAVAWQPLPALMIVVLALAGAALLLARQWVTIQPATRMIAVSHGILWAWRRRTYEGRRFHAVLIRKACESGEHVPEAGAPLAISIQVVLLAQPTSAGTEPDVTLHRFRVPSVLRRACAGQVRRRARKVADALGLPLLDADL
jgi:hypothetical protein